MWIIAAAAAGLVGTVLALILGQYRPEFRMLVTAAVTLLLMAMVLEQLSPVLEQLRSTMELTGLTGDYAAVLFKAVGICLLTQLAGDVCRDSGESSIASKIELAGRAAILLTAMPLIQEVLAWAWELMNL
ncbi:stage III sporulation AC/AD family protein [Hydrogenoanaerobacterium saccharovorans]|uniref:Stage III sporulation AC/AD family protein n=1 Tax=Hydrogenoanaerobacterium saccharovorans TaxID=474960 RepID=A0ABS2GM56_9FIRM|nr:SpoIIIAC/SpoIIIAD family protein [Hydrogenoanaerobacterium saccharovorans]MBM6923565.1 stage III sporulation AC/AD family protein [Hydrogenoanaerobacterium saccharovorans]